MRIVGEGDRVTQQRELARSGAVALGLGGVLGAGVAVVPAVASGVAGTWLLVGVPLAAVTAWCCALAASQQSAAYRGPGAVSACVRDKLGPVAGRVASATGLAGGVAAMAAVADAIGNYLPTPQPLTAAVAVLLVVAAATGGLRVRGIAAWLWLTLTFVVVAVVVAACFTIPPVAASGSAAANAPLGITGAAGVAFFGFLGFERLAAPARHEDRWHGTTVRRGLLVVIVLATVTYLAVGAALLHQLGGARLALSPQPLTDALRAADAVTMARPVAVGIAVALAPVLLGVLETVRSTGLAAVADGDLPGVLRRRGGNGTPYLLDLGAGLAALVVSLLLDPAQAISVAACCLLVHYALGNAAARVLMLDESTATVRTACLGMGLCVILAMSMPVPAMLATLVVVVAGPALLALPSRWQRHRDEQGSVRGSG